MLLNSSKSVLSTFLRKCRAYSGSNISSHSSTSLPSLTEADKPFASRHIGSNEESTKKMLSHLGLSSMEEFIQLALPRIPGSIQVPEDSLPIHLTESEVSRRFSELGSRNKVFKTFIGQGYYGTMMPEVIKRNMLENTAWYTPYTPYQPEISQGRLECLFNFQTMVCELTGLPISNASLLDEATAAAEAMVMLFNYKGKGKSTFLVDSTCFKRTFECLRLRATGIGIRLKRTNESYNLDDVFGILLQYPNRFGSIDLDNDLISTAKSMSIPIVSCTDLLALCLIKSPGELGFDVAVGSAQRFGVPLGFGGPHPAFFACKEDYKRVVPGRIVGLSKDSRDAPAYRLALQSREQHIRREKAISNICTSQALLANIAAMFAVYHGPEGLKAIAQKVNETATVLADFSERIGHQVVNKNSFFDTLLIKVQRKQSYQIETVAIQNNMNILKVDDDLLSISVDETTTNDDLITLFQILTTERSASEEERQQVLNSLMEMEPSKNIIGICEQMKRTTAFMKQSIFNGYHSEAELTRYMNKLSSKDFSLVNSMIPLGSCTMKLNASIELKALSMESFANIHPHVPRNQVDGYLEIFKELERDLSVITGLSKVSLEPNSGAQGEFYGLSIIRMAHLKKGDKERNICLVPLSAHGTNPASASMSGMKVVNIPHTKIGSVDLNALKSTISLYDKKIAAMMITYPSTFGNFDENILEACKIVHEAGGYIYLDGANMNAMCGYLRPADIGVDICHLNLHKTFCIPHGGGGPGAGPIAMTEELGSHLPTDNADDLFKVGHVSGSSFGSASILTISWAYFRLMGLSGLKEATSKALLHSNYMASRLKPWYPIKFMNSFCAHEFIIDMRPITEKTGISALDVAKRLQDYGFHAPTMSWPIPNSLMIEPTESESFEEIERYLEALISIRKEIDSFSDMKINPLKMAPHTMSDICDWNDRPYSIKMGAFPASWHPKCKLWPSSNRLDDAFGDLNLVCNSCK